MQPNLLACPSCRQTAPTLLRGLDSYCTACGARRPPLSALVQTPVNVAGQPSQVGGTVAKTAGWLVIAGGALSALLVGVLLQAIFPAGVAGWVLGITIALLAATLGALLLAGGSRLRAHGQSRQKKAELGAILSLAARRNGVVTPEDLASSLRISSERADAMLTELARSGDARLEVDDDGRLLYLFGAAASGPAPRLRVDAAAPGARSRVADASLEAAEEEAAAARDAERARR